MQGVDIVGQRSCSYYVVVVFSVLQISCSINAVLKSKRKRREGTPLLISSVRTLSITSQVAI